MKIHAPWRTALAAAVAVGSLAAVSGCSNSAATEQDKKTLNLWWYENPDQPNDFGLDVAIKQFEKNNPGITVKFQQKTFDQIQQSGKQILSSSAAPDVIEYNKGPATLGVAGKAGLLTDITEVAKQRGWDKKLSDATLNIGRVDTKTGLTGTGKLYGVPLGGEYLEVYYNADMLKKYGIEEPKTFDELESAMGTIKSKGITPLALGGGDYPIVHLIYELAVSKADQKWVADYQGLAKQIDFNKDVPFSFAANTVSDWLKKGYISSKASGQKGTDMINDYLNQKSPFMISGTWWAQQVQSDGKFKSQTFLLPGSGIHEGDPTSLFVVPTGAKNKDAAYKFIDEVISEGPQNEIANRGGVAVAADPAKVTDEVGLSQTKQFQQLEKDNAFGGYPDWPAAGYYNQILAAGQDLVSGQSTPDEYLTAIEGPYNTAAQAIAAQR